MRTARVAIGALLVAGCTYDLPDAPRAEKKPPRQEILNRTTREVLDLKQAQADNPNYVVVEGDLVQGNNPISQATSARIGLASEIGTWPIEQWAQHFEIEKDRFPTHAELLKWMDENPGVTLQARRDYHKYAYDADNGQIVIIEDTKLKEQIYKERGIPLN
ncbi:MAG: hypothetical protein WD069_10605 [Planctomycetales bacterium]